MKKILTMSAITVSLLFVVGCGGGSSSTASVETGKAYYLDSAVSGVNYKCGSQEGITGANGEFTFEVGQSCTFYLGDIKLRDMDKALLKDGAKIVEDDIKIATLLQSLDVDGNPDNGITLTPEVVEAAVATLNEDGNAKLPSTQAEVGALVASVENNVTNFEGHVVTEEQAQSHLVSTQTAVQTEATKALLAGKSFYTVDEADDGTKRVTQLIVNKDVTSMKAISPEKTEEWGITIDGNKLVYSDHDDGRYTLISQADGYIYFDDRNADGSKDGIGHRLYANEADAQAYLDSLGGGDSEPDNSKFSTEELTGKILVTFKDEDDGKPSSCVTLNGDGSMRVMMKKNGELQDFYISSANWKIENGNLRFSTSGGYQVWEPISRIDNQFRFKNSWYNDDGTLDDDDTRTLLIAGSCPVSDLVDE